MKIRQDEGPRVFLTSDTHYHHRGVCAGETSWVKLPRPFAEWEDADRPGLERFCLDAGIRAFGSLAQMDDALVAGINSTVGPDDVLFALGDWSFGPREKTVEFRERIVCRNVHLVLGNHDGRISKSSELRGLFASVQPYLEIEVDGSMACLFHYKQTVWNRSHRGSYHLYGHSHGSSEHIVNGRSMDVGVDNAYALLGEYRPFSFDEAVRILEGRKFVAVDHHGAVDRPQ